MNIQNSKHCGVKTDHGHDHLTDHMTELKNFTKGEICEFSAFPFSLQLMFDQASNNLIVCLMIFVDTR